WVFAVAFSADGERLALGGEYSLSIWDVATGKGLTDFAGHGNVVQTLEFSGDGTRLATGANDGAACVWDLNTGRMTHRFRGHRFSVPGLAFSPDGKTLATGEGQPEYGKDSGESHVRLFDLSTGKCRLQLVGHLHVAQLLRFSP